jgi:hypothetical protein
VALVWSDLIQSWGVWELTGCPIAFIDQLHTGLKHGRKSILSIAACLTGDCEAMQQRLPDNADRRPTANSCGPSLSHRCPDFKKALLFG